MPKHARRRFDDHDFQLDDPVEIPTHPPIPELGQETADDLGAGAWSTYNDDGVTHGPTPSPPWVITSSAAIDIDLGVLKSGKEADVSLVRRELDEARNLLAVKRYRSADHRMFHRDAAYLEGRKERKSRERRAMVTRTEFGRELIAARWAQAEFDVLSRLWSAGAAVPYPVQLRGTELMMEFVGSADGVAAQRLAQIRPTEDALVLLFEQLREALCQLALAGLAHGDLSAYNVLVDPSTGGGRVVLIDLPQAVDLVGNPRGADFMRRDCHNIGAWFRSRGLEVDPAALAEDLLRLAR